jgi:hypothetical protein
LLAQVTAAALVSENKQRAYPASVDSIPTSANQEDHVSMAAHGARRLIAMAGNAGNVVAIEALAAVQACDFHAPLRSSESLEAVRAAIRAHVPHLDEDRILTPISRRKSCAARRANRRGGRGVAGAMNDPDWSTVERREAPLTSASRTRASICCTTGRVSSANGARGATRIGTSRNSTISPSRSARQSFAPRCRARSSMSTATPAAALSIRVRRRTELAPTTTFDGDPLDKSGEAPVSEIGERRAISSRLLRRAGGRDRAAQTDARPRRA